MSYLLLVPFLLALKTQSSHFPKPTWTWRCSTEGNVWKEMPPPNNFNDVTIPYPQDICQPVQPNINCWHNDIASKKGIQTAAECCNFCKSTPGCAAWTLDSDHLPDSPICYAKKNCDGAKSMNNTISGPITKQPNVTIDINTSLTYQTMEGFGGCFNEKGWDALMALNTTQRNNVMRDLFDAKSGCKFTINRMPIGSSDFAMNYYSLNDSPGDLEMKNLTLARDRQLLIPYIKAAMAVQPGLRVWGSPWTGPEWMKDSAPMKDNYGCGSLSPDPKIRAAYALYLARAAKAFRAEGLAFEMLAIQNEPNQGDVWNNKTQSCHNSYPKMHWTGDALRDFVKDHLGPTFQKEGINDTVGIFLSTFPVNDFNGYVAPALKDPDSLKYLNGVGVQYAGISMIEKINAQASKLKVWETETPCGNGKNDWSWGEEQWGEMRGFIKNGASVYSQWNIVLDSTGKSGWGWKQSCMVTVNKDSKVVTYNPSFYAVKHFSYYVEPKAQHLALKGDNGSQQAIAFMNPGGQLVIGAINKASTPVLVDIRVDGHQMTQITLPAHSMNTFTMNKN